MGGKSPNLSVATLVGTPTKSSSRCRLDICRRLDHRTSVATWSAPCRSGRMASAPSAASSSAARAAMSVTMCSGRAAHEAAVGFTAKFSVFSGRSDAFAYKSSKGMVIFVHQSSFKKATVCHLFFCLQEAQRSLYVVEAMNTESRIRRRGNRVRGTNGPVVLSSRRLERTNP